MTKHWPVQIAVNSAHISHYHSWIWVVSWAFKDCRTWWWTRCLTSQIWQWSRHLTTVKIRQGKTGVDDQRFSDPVSKQCSLHPWFSLLSLIFSFSCLSSLPPPLFQCSKLSCSPITIKKELASWRDAFDLFVMFCFVPAQLPFLAHSELYSLFRSYTSTNTSRSAFTCTFRVVADLQVQQSHLVVGFFS